MAGVKDRGDLPDGINLGNTSISGGEITAKSISWEMETYFDKFY